MKYYNYLKKDLLDENDYKDMYFLILSNMVNSAKDAKTISAVFKLILSKRLRRDLLREGFIKNFNELRTEIEDIFFS